jgi:ankyrin repeat protein
MIRASIKAKAVLVDRFMVLTRRLSDEGYEAVVKMLLDKGADVNAQGGHYGNALQVASARGHKAVVKMLVSRGAKPL